MTDPNLDRRAFLTGGFLRQLLSPVINRATAPIERVQQALDQAQARTLAQAKTQGFGQGQLAAAGPAGPETDATTRLRTFPLLRPPGAIAEDQFLAGCTKCGDCHAACPHQAIRNAGPRFRQAMGTPMIDPHEQPCLACVDTPCITACLPQVLVRPGWSPGVTGIPVPTMGTAEVVVEECLAHQGSTCSSCHERCPVPGAFTIEQGRPTVVPDACIGCGVCQYVCPAPRNAIRILPLAERPPRYIAESATDPVADNRDSPEIGDRHPKP